MVVFVFLLRNSIIPSSLLRPCFLIAFSYGPDHIPGQEEAMNDLYKLDLKHLKWINVSPAAGHLPLARYSHGFTASFGKLYLFGGKSFGIGNVRVFLTLQFNYLQ